MTDVGKALKLVLFIALGILSAFYVFWWSRSARNKPAGEQSANENEPSSAPTPIQLAIGFVTNFFDTLGIGSFAPTTAAYKLLRTVRDEEIPGTMIVGHTLPVVAQAFIFITVIKIDPVMLVLMIIVAVIGGWFGAGIVSGLPRHLIQLGMGVALLMAAGFLLMTQFGLFPAGGDALSLSPVRLITALVMNFTFGALATLGIGNYAPSLVHFSLLAMDPRAAFPVMMGSGAFNGLVAGVRFINKRRFNWRAALGLTLGGIPAVLLAAFAVKSLSLGAIHWLVLVVIVYTAVTMLRSAKGEGARGNLTLIVEEKLP
jgi:uncharacterized membrane protein YfcA